MDAMRTIRTILSVLLLVSTGLGCTDQTGILIQVTSEQTSNSKHFQELQFFVGYPSNQLDTRFEAAENFPKVITLDPERDLQTDPYVLMLRPGPSQAKSIMVAVVGTFPKSSGRAQGRLLSPVAFVEGKVLQWDILLSEEVCSGVLVPRRLRSQHSRSLHF